MSAENLKNLGPLRPLVGTWVGIKGDDTAPSDDRGTEKNRFRERITFVSVEPVENHEQKLFGLRYSLQAWRLNEKKPFHDEAGYWLWDPKGKMVMRCLTIPRGMVTLAGGKAASNARRFKLTAKLGSKTFGICSNPFLDREFQTVGFAMTLTLNPDGSLTYDQVTKIRMKGRKALFLHRDKNTLKKIKA